MFISSNIDQVIARTQQLPQRINRAMAAASVANDWLEGARAVATNVLQSLARPDQVDAVKLFVNTVTATLVTGDRHGFTLRMRAPSTKLAGALANAQAAYGVGTPLERARGLFSKSITQIEDLILEWVQTPEEELGKRRDARDDGKSDEQIANLITYIMLSPTLGEKGERARDNLLPHIDAFIAKKMQQLNANVDADTQELWLRAVLHAWKEWVRVHWLERVREELRK